jgi:hypothetical protein
VLSRWYEVSKSVEASIRTRVALNAGYLAKRGQDVADADAFVLFTGGPPANSWVSSGAVVGDEMTMLVEYRRTEEHTWVSVR